MFLFITIFSSLAAVYTAIGLYAAGSIATTTDYFLAGKNVTLWPLIFTLLATQIGGGMLLGTAQEGYTLGLYGLTYTMGMCIGFLLLGFGFAQKLQGMGVITTAQLFQTRYKSVTLKKIASLISVATLSGILIGQIVGSKALLAGIGMNNEIIFILFWCFTIWYTMAGGLQAVVWTDVVQILFIIVFFGGACLYNIWLNPASMRVFGTVSYSSTAPDPSMMLATFCMPALFALIEQDLAQRFFAAQSARVARLAAFGAAVGLILFALIPLYFGMQARAVGLGVPAGSSPLMPYLATFCNDLALVLAICAIIAAITSTATSLLCAIGSNINQDFDLSWMGMQPVQLSRMVTCTVGCITLLASYYVSPNIIAILIASYELSVVCLCVPLVAAYLKKDVQKNAAIGAVCGGAAGFVLFRLISIPLIPKELAALALSSTGYVVGQFLQTTRKNVSLKKPDTKEEVL